MPAYSVCIGSALLKHILNKARSDGLYDVVFLHVQTNNYIALDFYKHFGFQIKGTVANYFRNLKPSEAFILEKWVNNEQENQKMDHTAIQPTSTSSP